MKTKWLTVFAGAVTAVVLVSLAMGFAAPDGSVGDKPTASSTPSASETATSKPKPTADPAPDPARAALAPESVRGVWPGRPGKASVKGKKVNWCPAVRITGEADAVRVFGAKAVDAAACEAVRFVFEKRYSRLSLPRQSYKPSNFDFVLPSLSSTTATQIYQPRINAFVANPGSTAARDELGLVLLRGEGKRGKYASAGLGRVYYGKAYTTRGYRGRAAWINPKWSTVSISVDYSKAQPRIAAKFTAQASVPVFNTAKKRDEMLTVATSATYFLRHGGGTAWSIGGWTVTTNTLGFFPLRVN
ncbi:hypothetical protein J2X11_000866 [Aeromicrobium panaciterrae]|uniref:Uncharacterized protein n=1 Tax=Aeromicrobium panaciterrae TaxID=363861 RepID=A0ABU1ULG3_9ACTN|nr:hypothetical protein [Aeromicrobium panaciterrae]MDR7086027.1 hypothetical protein [Aeromicrobium panaciterrae]